MTYLYYYFFDYQQSFILYIECWQDEPEKRPDIQNVKTRLIEMFSGTNTVNIVDHDGQQINEDNIPFSHSRTILLQKEFDEAIKNLEID